jgi:predicted  nucleic acid-binding Zn-ribbon protein
MFEESADLRDDIQRIHEAIYQLQKQINELQIKVSVLKDFTQTFVENWRRDKE